MNARVRKNDPRATTGMSLLTGDHLGQNRCIVPEDPWLENDTYAVVSFVANGHGDNELHINGGAGNVYPEEDLLPELRPLNCSPKTICDQLQQGPKPTNSPSCGPQPITPDRTGRY
jgi:hypothetical protein